MTERQVGIVVAGDDVTAVEALVPDDVNSPVEIVSDSKWSLQTGGRAEAYSVMYRRCFNSIRESDVRRVIIKASGAAKGTATLSHLHSAELRGVIIAAAAASSTEVRLIAQAHISRTYGERKFEEYVKDDRFWAAKTTGAQLRKSSRPAAMVIIAARG